MSALRNVYVVAAKRTPFGTFGGKLKNFSATELGSIASKAALETLPKELPVDSVIFGNVLQTDTAAAYLARHVGHRAGLPVHVSALTVNRLCGSGFQSVINGVHEILLGESEIVLAGGAESMSKSPYVLEDVRWGTRFGIDQKLVDSLATALVDQYPTKTPMGMTAENLATKYGITRLKCDEFAMLSQKRYLAGLKAGLFDSEIVPVEIKLRKGAEMVATDEHPRPQTTLESLSKLGPAFKKDGGVVTAGNASGINDGAAALVIASEDAVKKHDLKPLARIVSWQASGVEPTLMGIGPVPAIKGALARAKLTLTDMDLIEVNEAFAAQYLAVEEELGLNREITNTNGGAIALGHPLGASGARILTHLTYELQRTGKTLAIGSACIGGGQGIAVILERA
jgi:acetyl-CoA acyltransferase 2